MLPAKLSVPSFDFSRTLRTSSRTSVDVASDMGDCSAATYYPDRLHRQFYSETGTTRYQVGGVLGRAADKEGRCCG